MPVLPAQNRTTGLRLFAQQVFNVSKECDQPSLDEPVGDASTLEKSHCSYLGYNPLFVGASTLELPEKMLCKISHASGTRYLSGVLLQVVTCSCTHGGFPVWLTLFVVTPLLWLPTGTSQGKQSLLSAPQIWWQLCRKCCGRKLLL